MNPVATDDDEFNKNVATLCNISNDNSLNPEFVIMQHFGISFGMF